jgi:hypothetical protein
MATLAELFSELNDPVLQQKTNAACLVAANLVTTEAAGTANHANRLKWAKRVFQDPVGQGLLMLRAVLAANNAATLAQITGASDATIQSAVNAAIDVLADGT